MSSFGRVVAAVSSVHFVVGIWVATAVPGPLLSADDIAYLSLGRTLAGEGASPIGSQPPYGLLYPILLAPGWLVGLAEPSMLTWARVVNAGLAAAVIPVLYLIGRRLLDADRGWALAGAIVGASLPAGFVTSSIVWTERLLPLLVSGAVLAITYSWQDRSRRAAAIAVLLAVALVAAHPRTAGAAMVVVLAAAAARWLAADRREAALLVLAGGVGAGAVELLRRIVHDTAFGDTGAYGVRDLSSSRGVGEVPDMLVHATGTLGYLTLAGAGLAVVGVIVLVRIRPLGLVPLGVLVGVVVVAGWFLTGVDRADAWFHGRYIEVCAPVLVASGVIGLRRLRARIVAPVLLVGPVVAGLFGAWSGPGANWSRSRSPVMMLGVEVSGAPFGSDIFEPGAAAAVALVVGLTLFALARLVGPAPLTVVALAITGVGVASGIEALEQLHETAAAGLVADALDGVVVDRLAVDNVAVQPNLVAAVAWEVGLDATSDAVGPRTSHLLLSPEAAAPPGATLVAELEGGSLWALG